MKNILFIPLFFCSLVYSQTNPVDTTYYKSGCIKSIFFKNDWVHYPNTVDVYYDCNCNSKEKHVRVADSAKGWIKEARYFYKDSVIITKHFGKTFETLRGISFDLSSYEPNHICIYLNITNDSLINRIAIQRNADNVEVPFRMGKTILWTEFKKPTAIKELNPVHLDDGAGDLIVKFYSHYYIKEIIYRRKNFKNKDEFLNTQYLFYPDNKIKQIGTYLLGYGRKGNWYTYYSNGKLSSQGEYCGSKFDDNGNEYAILKTGDWFYYSEEGCIEKQEVWNQGVLILSKAFNKI